MVNIGSSKLNSKGTIPKTNVPAAKNFIHLLIFSYLSTLNLQQKKRNYLSK